MNKKVLYLVHGAVIAALYVVLTMLANALGLANYAIQVRFSEALTILPVFTPAAIPGLFLGCIISNTMTGCMLLDIIFGSLATLIGAFGTYLLRNQNKWLAPLPPIIANTIIVPFVLAYVYHLEAAGTAAGRLSCADAGALDQPDSCAFGQAGNRGDPSRTDPEKTGAP